MIIAEIKDLGSIEYLIEFRLKDFSAFGAFETAYASAGLEANGPTVTYTLFKMMNAHFRRDDDCGYPSCKRTCRCQSHLCAYALRSLRKSKTTIVKLVL